MRIHKTNAKVQNFVSMDFENRLIKFNFSTTPFLQSVNCQRYEHQIDLKWYEIHVDYR